MGISTLPPPGIVYSGTLVGSLGYINETISTSDDAVVMGSDYNASISAIPDPCSYQPDPSATIMAISTAAYVILFFFGVTGNALVAIVIWNNVDMRSSTNYFLVNLSLADLMVILVCMPPSLLELYEPGEWILGEFMCYLVTMLDSATAHASILTLLAIAVERYYVICMPFKATYTCTSKRTLIICCVVWLIAFISSVPPVLIILYLPCQDKLGNMSHTCGSYASTTLGEAYIGAIAVMFFLLPCAFMTIIYCIIANTLRRHDNYMAAIRKKESLQQPAASGAANSRLVELASMPKRNSVEYLPENNHSATAAMLHTIDQGVNDSDSMDVATVDREGNHYTKVKSAMATSSSSCRHQGTNNSSTSSSSACQNLANAATRQSHRRVVLMLASVVAVFFVCWLPMRTVILWQIFAPKETVYGWISENHYTFLAMISGFRILIYINSAINPILYNLISSKFRVSFRRVICCEDAWRARSKRSISTRSFTSTSSLRIHSRTTDYHG